MRTCGKSSTNKPHFQALSLSFSHFFMCMNIICEKLKERESLVWNPPIHGHGHGCRALRYSLYRSHAALCIVTMLLTGHKDI